MTPKQIIQAHGAIRELCGTVLPYRTAREVAALKRRLEEEFATLLDLERALAAELGGQIQRDGLQFQDSAAAEAYQTRWEALLAEESDAVLPQADLSACVDTLRVSPGAVEALEGLVVFEREAAKDG